ncbi:SDR family NAD(P)-dependent oxidoreductase [bacterium]|nr:SDR family NAD(P)-dependent oxidoreductase [bacterium]MCP5462850.1 SDR family NAD(P)-dependent oxidoreductase [bacterium]
MDGTKTVRKAVIIGASSGIGEALARDLSGRGYEVGLAARRIELLKKIQSELPAKSYVVQLDITKHKEAMDTLEKLLEKMGDVELIIINSGVRIPNSELLFSNDADTIDVNVTGFVAMATVASNYFMRRLSGHIVGISSIASLKGSGGSPAYNASKAFVSRYMDGIRQKLRHSNIYVTDVRPGFVDTKMVEDIKARFWVASSEKAARQIRNAIDKRKRIVYITRRWTLLALIARWMPEILYNWAYCKFREW